MKAINSYVSVDRKYIMLE